MPPSDHQPTDSRRRAFVSPSFLWVSLFIALTDALFVWFNYRVDHQVFQETLSRQGEQARSAFQMNLLTVSTTMQQIATYVAHDPRVQELFLQGRRAVEAEGGGKGGERAARHRQALLQTVQPGWARMSGQYDIRQLHFHLAPGATSFLRVHSPKKFGDDLSPVRHSIVSVNTDHQPTKGFESGRVYAGIRGVVPVFAQENGETVHVGALEAGTSFDLQLGRLKQLLGMDIMVLMTMDHARESMWPDFLKNYLQERVHSGQWLAESTTHPGEGAQILPQWEERHRQGVCHNANLFHVAQRPTAVYCFPLRDFLGERDLARPPVGTVLMWRDATTEYGEFREGLRNNILFAVGGVVFIELLLVIFWRWGTRHIRQLVQQRTRELELANRALTRAKEEAERANAAKSRFFAMLSHDIRAPLNAILGMASLLLENPLPPETRRHATTLEKAGRLLGGLIDDILDSSRIEAGQFHLTEHPFDPREVVEEILQVLGERAQQQGTTLTGGVDPAVPGRLLGDGGRLRQILMNLVGNAIKFTRGGEVSLRIIPGEGGGILCLVEDTGIGIPPDRLEAIFDPFSQASRNTHREYGGTGLGLHICRQLVQQMGGGIRVTSREGEGSRFEVTLPLPPTAAEPAPRPLPGEPLPPLTILAVEDAEENRTLLQAFLRDTGHLLELAENGLEAVERVRNRAYDLLLMDWQMPLMDGQEATRTIRAWEREGNRTPTPIIALSAHDQETMGEQMRKAGCDGLLSKPLSRETLLGFLHHFARERAGRADGSTAAPG